MENVFLDADDYRVNRLLEEQRASARPEWIKMHSDDVHYYYRASSIVEVRVEGQFTLICQENGSVVQVSLQEGERIKRELGII